MQREEWVGREKIQQGGGWRPGDGERRGQGGEGGSRVSLGFLLGCLGRYGGRCHSSEGEDRGQGSERCEFCSRYPGIQRVMNNYLMRR